MPESHEFREAIWRQSHYKKHSTVVFHEKWVVSVDGKEFDRSPYGEIGLVIWDPVEKRMPGENRPLVEIYLSGDLKKIVSLSGEVKWMNDIWAACYRGEYLYVKGQISKKPAEFNGNLEPVYIFLLQRQPLDLVYRGLFFLKN